MAKPDLLPVPLIDELYFQGYETMLPTAFNESLSLLEKVNKILHAVNESGKLTNEMIKKWNEVITWVLNDGLEEAVKSKLEEWLADGTLEDIIGQVLDDLLALKADLAYVNSRLNDVSVNVKQFGAIGNGTHDDAPAIQQALDYVTALPNGGTVLIPMGGTYSLGSELTIRKNTRLLATGAKLVRNHRGYMIFNGVRTDNFSLYNGNGNIEIDGGHWYAEGQNGGLGSTMTFGHGENIRVRNATLYDASTSHAIEFNGCKKCLVENCKLLGIVDPLNDHVFTEAIQLDINKPGFGLYAFGYADNTPSRDVVIRNNYFGNSSNPASRSWGMGIGTHTSTIGFFYDNILIEGNHFDGLLLRGIRTYSYRYVAIKNNRFTNCLGGILIETVDISDPKDTVDGNMNQTNQAQPVRDFLIENNYFSNIKNYHTIDVRGIAENGQVSDVTIRSNYFESQSGSEQYAIKVGYATNVVIDKNIMVSTTSNGIGIVESKNIVVEGNVVNKSGRHGIYVATNSENVVIQNNICNESRYDGIAITDFTSRFQVQNNQIRKFSLTAGEERSGISVTSTCDTGIISGNMMTVDPNKAQYGIYITNTNKDIMCYGNYVKGTYSQGNIYNTSSGGNSDGTNLI